MAFGGHLDCWNWSSIPGVIVQMKFVTLSHKQKTIWTQSDIFWIVQLTRNILADDNKYILRITTERKPSELYGWLCSKNRRKTRGTHN